MRGAGTIVPKRDRAADAQDDRASTFYADENALYDTVAAFLQPGLAANESVLVIATEQHAAAIQERLRKSSTQVDQALAQGTLRFVDAACTLERFVVGSTVDADRFQTTVGNLIGDLSGGPVRIYGEMVDLLWQRGDRLAAIHLEELWCDLQDSKSFALFFNTPFDYDTAPFAQPPEVLLAELKERRRVEKILRASLRDLRSAQAERDSANQRTERLTAITSAIADAVTHQQVYQAVVDQVAATLNASSGGLWLIDDDHTHAALVHSMGYHADTIPSLSLLLSSPKRIPALDAITGGEPIWIPSQEALVARYPNLQSVVTAGRSYQIAVLPVRTPGRMLGSLGFTFDGGGADLEKEKSLLLLVARYCGQALERLRLLDAERSSRAQTERLYLLAAAVNRAQSIEEVLSSALDAIGAATDTTRAAVLSYDAGGVMRFKASRGLSEEYRCAVEGHSPWARDVQSPEPILVADVAADPEMQRFLPVFRREKIAALGFIPLVMDGALLGKFMVYYDSPRILSSHELGVSKAIASHVATALARFAAEAELQKNIRFSEMFMGILGHDLRNPLTAILMAAHLMSKRSGDEALAKPLARMVSSGERMARMIDQLLDFTRVRLGGNIPVQPASIDLASIVRQTMDELHDAHPDSDMGLERRGDTSGQWDGDRLLQVFSNLLGNALQHGGRNEGVRARVDGTAADHVRVEICNQGTIPAHLLETLFDPMTRGQRQPENTQGLGLGLFITREIVHAHHGRITVQSTESMGTVFTVQLPRVMGSPGVAIMGKP